VGENEEKEKMMMVRTRGQKEQKKMKAEDLIGMIREETEGLPFKSLPMAAELSKRPKFVG